MPNKPSIDYIFTSMVVGGLLWGVGWGIVYSLFLVITCYPNASLGLMVITGMFIGLILGIFFGAVGWILLYVLTLLIPYSRPSVMGIFPTILMSALSLLYMIPLSPRVEHLFINAVSVIFGSWYLIQRALKPQIEQKEKRKNA